MNFQISHTDFILRLLQQKDLEAFSQYRSIPAVAQFQSWTNFTFDDAKALLQQMMAVPFAESDQWYQVAIVDPQSDKLMGDIALHFIADEQMEIGFTIAPKFQHRQLATRAVSSILDYLFNALHKHRVIAQTDVLNKASIKLLQKLGFRQEGHFIENIFFKGNWGSEYLFALLGTDWENHNN